MLKVPWASLLFKGQHNSWSSQKGCSRATLSPIPSRLCFLYISFLQCPALASLCKSFGVSKTQVDFKCGNVTLEGSK